MKIAHYCRPLSGHAIAGYITRKGVSIHRAERRQSLREVGTCSFATDVGGGIAFNLYFR